MAEHFAVTERTVWRDLADLQQHHHMPLPSDEHGYRILEGATLRPLNLTAEERAILNLALTNPVLRRSARLRRRVEILEAKLHRANATAEETPEALRLASVDRSGASVDRALPSLERAAQEQIESEILYASLSGRTRRWRGLDPYQIFHRAEAWYVVGRCHVNQEVRIFRLDRISDVRLMGVTFERPKDFDLDRYLADSWSIFRGKKRHDVVLHFDSELAPLLRDACHHEGEKLSELEDGVLEYRVRLNHLDEIARWVVGFGGRCRVVGPEELRQSVLELACGAAAECQKLTGGSVSF